MIFQFRYFDNPVLETVGRPDEEEYRCLRCREYKLSSGFHINSKTKKPMRVCKDCKNPETIDTCSRCGIQKPLYQFNRVSGFYRKFCKECENGSKI